MQVTLTLQNNWLVTTKMPSVIINIQGNCLIFGTWQEIALQSLHNGKHLQCSTTASYWFTEDEMLHVPPNSCHMCVMPLICCNETCDNFIKQFYWTDSILLTQHTVKLYFIMNMYMHLSEDREKPGKVSSFLCENLS